MKPKNIPTLRLIKSIGRSSSRLALLLIPLVFVCFALSPMAQAGGPPPDGGYPGQNTAEGDNALFNLSPTDGGFNTAIGWSSLFANTTGSFNTGVGAGTLSANTSDNCTAVGAGALTLNTNGEDNCAVGAFALLRNTTGHGNVAIGFAALVNNNRGTFNTAVGDSALNSNVGGFSNTAVGNAALSSCKNGDENVAVGDSAGMSITRGKSNVAVGQSAGQHITKGSGNLLLGAFAGENVTDASGVICIDSDGANVDNTTWIRGVYNVTTQSSTTMPVIVSDTGQLGTIVSSKRFKKDIATMEKASEAILSLRPVTFHYKTDTKGTPQFGLIAEEVAKVNPALVLPDKEGKPYTVRYDAVNAMLLNEFLKEHRKVEELTKEFQTTVAQQQKQIEALTTGLQKVSAQLEASKPAPQVVNNP
jgi:Chaperone of endosialidase